MIKLKKEICVPSYSFVSPDYSMAEERGIGNCFSVTLGRDGAALLQGGYIFDEFISVVPGQGGELLRRSSRYFRRGGDHLREAGRSGPPARGVGGRGFGLEKQPLLRRGQHRLPELLPLPVHYRPAERKISSERGEFSHHLRRAAVGMQQERPGRLFLQYLQHPAPGFQIGRA